MKKLRIFVSSVQKEFQEERYAIRDFSNEDDLVKKGVLRKVGETGRNTHYTLELNRT